MGRGTRADVPRRVARLASALVGAALLAPGPAGAQLPFAEGTPQLLVAGQGGTNIVVWGPEPTTGRPGALTVDIVRPDGVYIRASLGSARILDWSRTAGGDLDLLVAEGSPARRLVLHRIFRSGVMPRVWSTAPRGDPVATVARRGRRLVVAWHERGTLRLVTSPDGMRFSKTRRVPGVLSRRARSLSAALGTRGSIVVAATVQGRRRPSLVLASLTRAGRVRPVQRSPNVDGRVEALATPRGRIAVLVDDTGECGSDGGTRRIWTALRRSGALRFGPVQLVDTACGARARMVVGRADRVAVLWSTAAQTVRMAVAPDRHAFAAYRTAATGFVLRAATSADGGIVAFLQATDGERLVAQGLSSGGGPLRTVATGPVDHVLGDADPDGQAAVAWTDRGGLHVARLG